MFGLFKKKPASDASTVKDVAVCDVSAMLERIEGVPMFSQAVVDVLALETTEVASDGEWAAKLTAATRSWLACLNAETFDGRLQSGESAHFMLHGDVEPDRGRSILAFTETTLARYRDDFPELMRFGPASKMAILAFSDDDDYYRYASAYYPDGHFGLSSGMFLQRGLGHFVFPNVEEMWHLEATIVHELLHAVVAHLPLPAWVNEGLATSAEFRYGNRFEDPRHTETLMPHHRRFWNGERLQSFWSGDAFHHADEGQELSYDLARRLVRGLSTDWERMQRFVLSADADDAGEQAARAVFGYSLAIPLEATIGIAGAAPDPARWVGDSQEGGFH